MSELKKLKQKYDADVKQLQESCPHPEISDWMPVQWAPGHYSGYSVKLCKRCGKTLDRRGDAIEKPRREKE